MLPRTIWFAIAPIWFCRYSHLDVSRIHTISLAAYNWSPLDLTVPYKPRSATWQIQWYWYRLAQMRPTADDETVQTNSHMFAVQNSQDATDGFWSVLQLLIVGTGWGTWWSGESGGTFNYHIGSWYMRKSPARVLTNRRAGQWKGWSLGQLCL